MGIQNWWLSSGFGGLAESINLWWPGFISHNKGTRPHPNTEPRDASSYNSFSKVFVLQTTGLLPEGWVILCRGWEGGSPGWGRDGAASTGLAGRQGRAAPESLDQRHHMQLKWNEEKVKARKMHMSGATGPKKSGSEWLEITSMCRINMLLIDR